MEILIIIDNILLNYKWSSIFNSLKRWLIYWLNHNLINIKTLTIAKTIPEPNFTNLSGDKLTLENIINCFEGIIINKVDELEKLNIKHIFDIISGNTTNESKYSDKIVIKENNQINKNIYTDIFIFCSIPSNNLSQTNVNYILESISSIEIKKINIFNVSLKKIFPINQKINELTLKSNIFSQQYYDLNTFFNFASKENDFKIIDYKICDILAKLYEIELEITKTSHWSEQPIEKTKIQIYYDYIEKLFIDKLKIEGNNICSVNFIKYCINYVRMIVLEKVNDVNFNIPIPKINEKLIMDYAIETIKFYNIVYPKMLCHHINKQNSKFNFSLSKIKQIDFTNFNIKDFDNDESTNYLYSNTTMTNWKQEYQNLNPFGILVMYNPSNYSYKGIYDFDILSTYPNLMLSSISNNFISLFDYYQLVSADIDMSTKNYFNINEYEFIDNLHGNSNIILPIYINKEHWDLVKKYWSFHMSFINKAFEFDYNKKMDNIYFFALLKVVNKIMVHKNNQNTIRLFFYILRTCIQICIDNKYSYNNKPEYNKHFTALIECTDYNYFKKNFSNYLIRLMQVILTNGINQTELTDNLNLLLNTFLKQLINIDYSNEIIEEIKQMDQEKKNTEYEIILSKFDIYILSFYELKRDVIFLSNLIKYIYEIKKFNQLIKYLDKYNGCLPIGEDDLNYELIEKKINDELIKEEENIDYKQIIINTGLFD
jgi:hypothetical protein